MLVGVEWQAKKGDIRSYGATYEADIELRYGFPDTKFCWSSECEVKEFPVCVSVISPSHLLVPGRMKTFDR